MLFLDPRAKCVRDTWNNQLPFDKNRFFSKLGVTVVTLLPIS